MAIPLHPTPQSMGQYPDYYTTHHDNALSMPNSIPTLDQVPASMAGNFGNGRYHDGQSLYALDYDYSATHHNPIPQHNLSFQGLYTPSDSPTLIHRPSSSPPCRPKAPMATRIKAIAATEMISNQGGCERAPRAASAIDKPYCRDKGKAKAVEGEPPLGSWAGPNTHPSTALARAGACSGAFHYPTPPASASSSVTFVLPSTPPAPSLPVNLEPVPPELLAFDPLEEYCRISCTLGLEHLVVGETVYLFGYFRRFTLEAIQRHGLEAVVRDMGCAEGGQGRTSFFQLPQSFLPVLYWNIWLCDGGRNGEWSVRPREGGRSKEKDRSVFLHYLNEWFVAEARP